MSGYRLVNTLSRMCSFQSTRFTMDMNRTLLEAKRAIEDGKGDEFIEKQSSRPPPPNIVIRIRKEYPDKL